MWNEHNALELAVSKNATITYDRSDLIPYLKSDFLDLVDQSPIWNELQAFKAEMTANDCRIDVHRLQDTIHRSQLIVERYSESCESTYTRIIRGFEMVNDMPSKTTNNKLIDPVDVLRLFTVASSASK